MKYPKQKRKSTILNSKLLHKLIATIKFILKIVEVLKFIIDAF